MENKLNKYGCRPSGDVCLEHDSPLITFGICADSPELKDFIQEIRLDTLRRVLKYIDRPGGKDWDGYAHEDIENLAKSL